MWVLVAVVASASVSAAGGEGKHTAQAERSLQTASAPVVIADYRAVLNKYCITCHNDKLKTAGLMLDRIASVSVAANAEQWEKVVRKLRTAEMPPSGRPRPDQATYDTFASWLEHTLDAASAANPNPGRATLHRLNRSEYANAIRDLLAVEIDIESLLPADDTANGFDNMADTLGISPLLLEQYMVAAEKISRVAIGDPAIPPITKTFRPPPDLTQTDHFEGLPFGTRGGMLINYTFPVSGEYTIAAKLGRAGQTDTIRGLEENHDVEFSLDGVRLRVWTLDGERYKKAERRGNDTSTAGVSENEQPDHDLKIDIPIVAGPHTVAVAFIKKTSATTDDTTRPLLKDTNGVQGTGEGSQPNIGSVSISGPFGGVRRDNTPSRQRIFVCHPTNAAEEVPCARRIVTALARRAFRRPVTGTGVRELMSFYVADRKNGTFDDGIELALRRILVSPQFIFRFERDNSAAAPGATYRVSDVELASRLSFFLWSSIPDDELLNVAERGALSNPAELERQVRRMLDDPRSQALVTNFAGQWLYLRNLDAIVPDGRLFPDFDDNLRQAFRRETELLFESVMREHRSVLTFLTADYTFVNERLARHYGMAGILGDHFRRVAVTDPNRRGLLGHGSILTVTSYGTRTSPVIRGKWILDNLLAAPPPAPPPNVPELKVDSPEPGKVLTMRDRMAQHRANPVCAGCHARMDPLGFALENFDAVGRWRATDLGLTISASGALRPSEFGTPIDPTGILPNGTAFAGPDGLRSALLGRPELFVKALTEKLLVYALGRGLDYYDEPTVRAIVQAAGTAEYRFDALVAGIVKSMPFQMRRAAPRAPDAEGAAAAAR
jgi:hypothetical protein